VFLKHIVATPNNQTYLSLVQLPWLMLRFFMSSCVFSLAFKYSPLFKHITYIFLCIYFLGNLKSLGLLETYKVVINSELLLFEALIASRMDAPSEGAIALSCSLVENPIKLFALQYLPSILEDPIRGLTMHPSPPSRFFTYLPYAPYES
jgi:hypothetical protein